MQSQKNRNNFELKVEIANYQDILDFAISLSNIKSSNVLTQDEKLKIIMSYPFEFNFKQVS